MQRALAAQATLVIDGSSDTDLSNASEVIARILDVKPDLVINAAAYTKVDQAESEPDLADAVNHLAPRAMSKTCRKLNVPLIHYSTDYVFDGRSRSPYKETDQPFPLNVYGQTKLGGDLAIQESGCEHTILRVGWVYSDRGRNFPNTIQRLATEGKPLRVVNDQIGSPTWARQIAEATALICYQWQHFTEKPYGLFHLPSAGETSWCGFAEAVLKTKGIERAILPIVTADFPTPATRPMRTVMDGDKIQETLGVNLPHWQDQLQMCFG